MSLGLSLVLLLTFSFTSAAPTITAMTSCLDTGYPSITEEGGFCRPGTPISIFGSDFVASSPFPLVVISGSREFSQVQSVNCSEARVLNASTAACVLPELSERQQEVFCGRQSTLTVLFSPYVNASQSFWLFGSPEAPFITSVSGCGASTSPLAQTECRGADVLTLSGRQLSDNDSVIQSIFPSPHFRCALLAPPSATTLLCRLPAIDVQSSEIQAGEVYNISLQANANRRGIGGWKPANFFSLAFTFAPIPSAPSDSSSLSRAASIAIVSIAVVISTVGAVAAVSFMCWWRRRSSRGLLDRPGSAEQRW